MISKRSNFDLNYPNEYGEGRGKRNEFNSLINQLNLLRGIYNFQFKEPTDVQQFTIKQILMGNSIIIQSKLCSGKTSAFVASYVHTFTLYNSSNPNPFLDSDILFASSITLFIKSLKL